MKEVLQMSGKVRRIHVEKKKGYNIEASALYRDLKDNLGVGGLKSLRIINRYDVEGVTDDEYARSLATIFSEPPVDVLLGEQITFVPDEKVFAVEYLPGQYDQRADSAAQCVQVLAGGGKCVVKTARLIVTGGDVSLEEYRKIKEYCINPVDSREASLEKPDTLDEETVCPPDVKVLEGFTSMSVLELEIFASSMGFAMSLEDLEYCKVYFRDIEKRNPTVTELRVLDTYWSDHCRHTTFMASVENVEFEEGKYTGIIKDAYGDYLNSREYVYGEKRQKDICLMDIATIAMKELKKRGILDDLDESDEINACSIKVNAVVDGKPEEWLVMFKNETHNHPTEIEPFGGAATCLGGAIRDPLSGRVYVYQAMRVTGSADPGRPVEQTIPGKLPQRKITTGAAAGYSSYGNQIGLATGQVSEIYDEGYMAKRMEIGAVIGAAPAVNVVRARPEPGDVIILLGGRTGRDGCGGATGSSKEHTEESLASCGAEVQKGNPPTERKIQRLFRKPDVTRLIKKCNDFGAGGVSVAIGELAQGLLIDLDKVPKKYEGLDGTELAISESQERMAVMVSEENVQVFLEQALVENLEATPVAVVTDDKRLRMKWRGKLITDISRDFLDTNGVRQKADVRVKAPNEQHIYFDILPDMIKNNLDDIEKAWLLNLERLEVCSQKGLVERFDSTIGAASVLMPFGGTYQLSPEEGMAAKLPVIEGDTTTGTLMTWGYNPSLAKWSPFHAAVYSVVEACAKIASLGGNYKDIRLTLQEFFEKLKNEPERWGKPFGALLGAYYAQMKLGIPAIGGKDSMSGSFNDMDVPPTLVAFAVCKADMTSVISAGFKKPESSVVLLKLDRNENGLPDFVQLDKNYTRVFELSQKGKLLAASTVREGGIAAAISRMCFGEKMGLEFKDNIEPAELFRPYYGAIILEFDGHEDVGVLLEGIKYQLLGKTRNHEARGREQGDGSSVSMKHKNRPLVPLVSCIRFPDGRCIEIDKALRHWMQPLESIFPSKASPAGKQLMFDSFYTKGCKLHSSVHIARPRIFIPVFPGINCEYDTAKVFEKAGGKVETLIFKNLVPKDIETSAKAIVNRIDASQIIALPGGFSAGDEPEGSGKFIAAVFRNPYIQDAVMRLLKQRDGLIIGICNGFQALIKLGLVPYGEIRELKADSPTLTYNTIGRHVSCMVRTKVVSNLSPWLSKVKPGDIHVEPVSHGEGRFVARREDMELLMKNGQVATRYVDLEGAPTYDPAFNPNGSMEAIEGITSIDGRVFGKMAHSERAGSNVAVNVPGNKNQKIFKAGVEYFL
jgi:phosphoribosylformylglycinamidine synthase